jgi:hypothetical protein
MAIVDLDPVAGLDESLSGEDSGRAKRGDSLRATCSRERWQPWKDLSPEAPRRFVPLVERTGFDSRSVRRYFVNRIKPAVSDCC